MESAGRTGPVHYRTAAAVGVNVFYREAGPEDAPVVLQRPTLRGPERRAPRRGATAC